MTLLDRHLGYRLALGLLRSVVALAFLFVVIDLTTHRRREIIEYDIPPIVVAEYYLNSLPAILRDFQVAALAVLVSCLFEFGRAAQNREIVAMLASGIGLYRFIRVPALVALLWAAGAFAISESVGVPAAERAAWLESEYFDGPAGDVAAPVSWANLDGGWTCHVFAFDRGALSGEGVLMLNLGESRVEQIEAGHLQWDATAERWMMEGGLWSVFYPKAAMEVETRAIGREPAPIAESPQALFLSDQNPGAKTLSTLREEIALARHRSVPTQRIEVGYHSRFAAPALSFIMFWIALPFALRLGRGGLAFSLAGSAGIGLAYFIVYAGAIGLGNIGRIEPWLAAWFANLVFGAAAAVMTYRTTT